MTCQDTTELFTSLADGTLTAAEREAFQAHLETCAECRAELSQYLRVVKFLRGVEPAWAPAGFAHRALAAAGSTAPRPARRFTISWAWRIPVAAAAGVLVAVTVALLYRQSPDLQQAARSPSELRVSQAPVAPPPAREATPEASRPPAGSKASVPEAPIAGPGELARPAELEAERRADATAPPAASTRDRQAGAQKEAPPAAPPRAERPAAPRAATSDEDKVAAVAKSAPSVGRAAPAPPAPTSDDTRASRYRSAPAARKVGELVIVGRLETADTAETLRVLSSLVAAIDGEMLARRDTPGAIELEIGLPGDAYASFAARLARVGRWQAEPTPAVVADRVRVVLRIGR